MKLEDELKQSKPFENEFQKLMLNINVTSSWLNVLLSDMLKPYGITAAQFNVLRILKGRYPKSYCNQEITERMIDKNSNATRIVDKLIVKGLVKRCEKASDRRAVEITITEKGFELTAQIDVTSLTNHTNIKTFNIENARKMNEWLDELRG